MSFTNTAALTFATDLRRRRDDMHCALDTISRDFTTQQRALLHVHNIHAPSFSPLLQSHIALFDARQSSIHHRATLNRQRQIIAPLRNSLRDVLAVLDTMDTEMREMDDELSTLRTVENSAMGGIVAAFLDLDRQYGLEYFPRASNDFDPFTTPMPVPPPYQSRNPSPPIASPIPIPPRGYIRDSINGDLIRLPIDSLAMTPAEEPSWNTLQYPPEEPMRSSSELSYRTVPEEPEMDQLDSSPSPQLVPPPPPSRQNLTPGPSFIPRSPRTLAQSSPRLSRNRRIEASTRRAIQAAIQRSPILTRRRSNS